MLPYKYKAQIPPLNLRQSLDDFYFVTRIRFELIMTAPKTVVLPLHHRAFN